MVILLKQGNSYDLTLPPLLSILRTIVNLGKLLIKITFIAHCNADKCAGNKEWWQQQFHETEKKNILPTKFHVVATSVLLVMGCKHIAK